MKTRLIGDIHGRVRDYSILIENVERSIQVGDFGIGFGKGNYWHDGVTAMQNRGDHRFIRGNHDEPAMCRTMPKFIEDGTVEGDVMFIGGAWSIDWGWRTAGLNWWEDEECSSSQLEAFIDRYMEVLPRVMITHDAPTMVTNDMFIQSGLALGGSNAQLIRTRTGDALQAMFDMHQPEEWYFGHWHHTKTLERYGTKFQCIGEMDFMDVEL